MTPVGLNLSDEVALVYVETFPDLVTAQRNSGKSVEDYGRLHWRKHGHKESGRLVKLRQLGYVFQMSPTEEQPSSPPVIRTQMGELRASLEQLRNAQRSLTTALDKLEPLVEGHFNRLAEEKRLRESLDNLLKMLSENEAAIVAFVRRKAQGSPELRAALESAQRVLGEIS